MVSKGSNSSELTLDKLEFKSSTKLSNDMSESSSSSSSSSSVVDTLVFLYVVLKLFMTMGVFLLLFSIFRLRRFFSELDHCCFLLL